MAVTLLKVSSNNTSYPEMQPLFREPELRHLFLFLLRTPVTKEMCLPWFLFLSSFQHNLLFPQVYVTPITSPSQIQKGKLYSYDNPDSLDYQGYIP